MLILVGFLLLGYGELLTGEPSLRKLLQECVGRGSEM